MQICWNADLFTQGQQSYLMDNIRKMQKEKIDMQEIFCESCGMPLAEAEDMFGTEADGNKSTEYCIYCYEKGAFTEPDLTLEEQIKQVSDMMIKDYGYSPEDAREQCQEGIPTLKRWKTV